MGLQVKKLLVMFVLLVFAILSLCEAKKATVEVVGLIHCSDCLENHSTITNSSQGFDVLITCNSRKNETRTQGNGGVDKQGKFNVTLSVSAEIQQDSTQIDGCYAKLQSRSGAPCHIQQPQTASLKIISNGENEAVTLHTPTVIKFSPLTCQSAFFWLFPNLTFFGSPPSPEVLPPVQPPLPPPENSSPPPQPADDPLLPPPEIEAPSPPPSAGPVAAPPPTYQNPTDPEIGCPSPPPQEVPLPLPSSPLPPPPSSPVYNKPPSPAAAPPLPPPINGPIQSPSPPKRRNQTPPTTVIAPPTPALSSSPPRPLPSPGKAIQPPPSATIPGQRRPNPIPKAPPIPRLPVTPSIPRKYFNAPNSKSKPPRSV